MKMDCVVDASVGVKLFVPEPWSDVAEAIFAGLRNDPRAHVFVPELFYSECANTLWKRVRRFNYPLETARQSLRVLNRLALGVVRYDVILPSAFELAVEHGTTVYDACYVALANMIQLPLITADERLVNNLQGTSFDVRWIGKVELSGS